MEVSDVVSVLVYVGVAKGNGVLSKTGESFYYLCAFLFNRMARPMAIFIFLRETSKREKSYFAAFFPLSFWDRYGFIFALLFSVTKSVCIEK